MADIRSSGASRGIRWHVGGRPCALAQVCAGSKQPLCAWRDRNPVLKSEYYYDIGMNQLFQLKS
jgi:hypothetical protein